MAAPVLSLHGRVALVTGVAGALGAAVAAAMAAAGARVALLDADGEGGERTADAIGRAGGDGLFVQADVTDAAAVDRAVRATLASWERLDVVVNATLHGCAADLPDVADEDWAETLAVNLRGAMVCTRAALGPMRAAGAGRILSTTSALTLLGQPGRTAFAASTGGIVAMTRAWARELGPLGITANAVAPGLIADATPAPADARDPAWSSLLARTAARRPGRAEEVAAVYVFLASDLASFINGAVVGVDGGLRL